MSFAEELAKSLGNNGDVSLQYITAQLQPYSNAQRPDVVWTPRLGGYAGQLFFFEIKLSTKPIALGQGFRLLVEHRDYAADALERPVSRYVFVTSAAIPEFSERFLAEHHIHAIANAQDVEAVLSYLRCIEALP